MASCLRCGAELALGSLCRAHAAEIATCNDITPEQVGCTSTGGANAWLVDQWGRAHGIELPALIGRIPNGSVAILHASVSAQHAQITADSGMVSIHDRNSLNGTFVNNQKITQTSVRNGDALRFGDVSFFFCKTEPTSREVPSSTGRTLPRRSKDLVFRATLKADGQELELLQRAGGGLVRTGDGKELELSRLEFELLRLLVERRLKQPDSALSYVPSQELADALGFRTQGPDTENVRELVKRVRKKLKDVGAAELIDSRRGVGYRIVWTPV